jgi:hypothetical protein
MVERVGAKRPQSLWPIRRVGAAGFGGCTIVGAGLAKFADGVGLVGAWPPSAVGVGLVAGDSSRQIGADKDLGCKKKI